MNDARRPGAFLSRLTTAMLFLAGATVAMAQQAAVMPPATIATEQSAALAEFWKALAEGKAKEVVGRARTFLGQHPDTPGLLATVIEVEIAASGGTTALATYESWFSRKSVEQPAVLRRIARAVLYEWARQAGDGAARSDALILLAEDGDPNAVSVINAGLQRGQASALRDAVRLKNPQAISQVAARIKASKGEDRLRDIGLLKEAKSPLAAPILIELLADPNERIRWSAADALGDTGNRAAVQALLPLLKDPHGIVRTAVAGSLYQLGDTSGQPILDELAASDNAQFRRTAAQLMASRPDERWLALVRGLLSDPDPTIRLDAAKLLAPHDPSSSRFVLDQLAGDASLAIREEAGLTKADLQTTSLGELRALLRSGSPTVRARAAGRILALTR